MVPLFQPIAKNAFTILINISHDSEVLEYLAKDDKFVEELLRKITVSQVSFQSPIHLLTPTGHVRPNRQ